MKNGHTGLVFKFLEEVGREADVDWSIVAKYSVQYQAVVNTALNFQILSNSSDYLSTRVAQKVMPQFFFQKLFIQNV